MTVKRCVKIAAASLLAAVALTPDTRLLTNDKRLASVAAALRLS